MGREDKMNSRLFVVIMGLLVLAAIAIHYFPWLRTFKLFVSLVRWLRNKPGPSLVSSLIGFVCLFGGPIANVLGYGEGKEWAYLLTTVVGVTILLIINWGSPLRRSE